VKKFQNIVKEDIQLFDKKFKDSLSTKAELLYKVTSYLRKNSGKKIRPLCAIIASGLINNITDKTYRSAILIELIHTATLVHDDIVDDAQIRRSKFSINTIWKNKIAVLTGDYFLAKGIQLAVKNKDYEIIDAISNVVGKIVEGELIQIEKTKKLNLKESDYFNIINLKTASLFECSFELGGIAAGAEKEKVKKLKELGLIIGIIFQIKDDILDYGLLQYTGKKSGNDIKEGKINLPLLYSLSKMKFLEKRKSIRILRNKKNTIQDIGFIFSMVKKYKGIDFSQAKINKYYEQAKIIIGSFEEGKYKKSIYSLLDFLIDRKK